MRGNKREKNQRQVLMTGLCLSGMLAIAGGGLPSVHGTTGVLAEDAFEMVSEQGGEEYQESQDLQESQGDSDDFLIEDDGELVIVKEGENLEEMLAAERTAAQAAAQAAMETEQFTEEEILEPDGPVLEPANIDKIEEYLDELTKTESPIGSDGELMNARYIRRVMEEYGFTVTGQSFHEGFLNEDGIDAPGENIIAERGADSQEGRTNDIFIVCTHYDSKTHPQEDDPFANDKSGVAVLLEMARILSFEETDTDICFLFLSGEEDGLYGSAHFVDVLKEEVKERIVGVIDVERVGYNLEVPYVLETADGEENRMGNLIKSEAEPETENTLGYLQTDSGVYEIENEAPEEGNEWEYMEGRTCSQYSFAGGGIDAVTVRQDIYAEANTVGEEEGQGENASIKRTPGRAEPTETADASEREEILIDTEKLQELTDLLSMVVARIMGVETESMLG